MRRFPREGKPVRALPYTFRMPPTASSPTSRDVDALVRLDPTPLLPVEVPGAGRVIWCKAEYQHPSGSTKDRIAAHMLGKAWREGRLRAGDEVVEASSGSTSIAMSMVCARLGLRFTAFMPEGVSTERSLMIRAYGGEVRLTPKADGIIGSLAACREHAARHGSFEPRQFENHENAEAHRVVERIFDHLCDEPEALREGPGALADRVTDYLAGMTDRYALAYAARLDAGGRVPGSAPGGEGGR